LGGGEEDETGALRGTSGSYSLGRTVSWGVDGLSVGVALALTGPSRLEKAGQVRHRARLCGPVAEIGSGKVQA